jgi:hypothetical protein
VNRGLEIPPDDERASWEPPPPPERREEGPNPFVDLGYGWWLAEWHGEPWVLDPEGERYGQGYAPPPVPEWPTLVAAWHERYIDPRLRPHQRPHRALKGAAARVLHYWSQVELQLIHACGHDSLRLWRPEVTPELLRLWESWPCIYCVPAHAPLWDDDYPEFLARQQARDAELRAAPRGRRRR